MLARLQRGGRGTWDGWQGTALRIGAVAALLATAGGLAVPAHRGLFGALALLVVLTAWLLPERRPAIVMAPAATRGARPVRG